MRQSKYVFITSDPVTIPLGSAPTTMLHTSTDTAKTAPRRNFIVPCDLQGNEKDINREIRKDGKKKWKQKNRKPHSTTFLRK